MPLISIVIPTRNRLYYLKDTLKSVLDQRSPDIEIIVADNATQDGTREYLASLGDAIRVVRSETPLSMSDNWDKALAEVRGDWVTFCGDDDCLMPDYVVEARLAIEAYPATEGIFWDTPIYRWPSSINENERNFLTFSLRSQSRTISSKETLRRMYEEIVNIMMPPGLYHGLVKTTVIRRAKELWGEFRLGKVPDLGSGIVFLSLTESYVMLGRPLSVMAFGSQSTGMSHKNAKPDFGPRLEFQQLSRPDDLAAKYPLIDVDNPNILQWRLLLDWADYLRPRGTELNLNNTKMLLYCIERLAAIPECDREDSATKLLAFCVKFGMPQAQAEGLIHKGLNRPYGFRPGQNYRQEGDFTELRLGINLGRTPIKTATGAAGLIAGHFS